MWPNSQEIEDLVTFTDEFLNGKLHFLSNVNIFWHNPKRSNGGFRSSHS